jgi:hypothetical protein
MNKHPNLPSGTGHAYVIENVYRALRDLCDESHSWKKRIIEACNNAHRPADNECFTGYMSDETLQSWRDCRIGRFGKTIDDLDDEEVEELASNLRAYVFGVCRDKGICEAGGDPKAFEPFSDSPTGEEGRVPPQRNKNEDG